MTPDHKMEAKQDDEIRKQKAEQACEILAELGIDCWLVWVRETMQMRDPSLDHILGSDVISPTALLYTRDGERIAVAQESDALGFSEGLFERVVPYKRGIGDALRKELARLDPRSIAINRSEENVAADGMSVGMLAVLLRLLEGTRYPDRLVSADPLIERLRGRKVPEEIRRIERAVQITERIFSEVHQYLEVGQSETEIQAFVRKSMRSLGVSSGWDTFYCPAVDAGPNKQFGHAPPGNERTKADHLLHFDFGVRTDGYCADLQRMFFFGPPERIPEDVQRAFNTVHDAIQAAAEFLRPGRVGHEVDAVAREFVITRGYNEYGHGTGHQIGRFVHDGGMRLAPQWEIFGKRSEGIVEPGNVFTLELGVRTLHHGQVNLEEDVLVTENGCRFLSTPQQQLACVTL